MCEGRSVFDLSMIVATRNRPAELRRMLRSVEAQTVAPLEIIVMDGSEDSQERILEEFPILPIRYFRSLPPSAARQRNEGIQKASPDAGYVGFFDDDITLEPGSLGAMREFWDSAGDRVGGAAFNMLNHPPLFAGRLKSSPAAERLGLYSRQGGRVLPSGFQTMIGVVRSPARVEWLPTGAAVWRKRIFREFGFDERFQEYSYLEDLDFSLQVGKKYELWVVADAGYRHFPGASGRGSDYQFGQREVCHRLYLVRKHKELSPGKCRLALVFRLMINLSLALKPKNRGDRGEAEEGPGRETNYLRRAAGNVAGMVRTLFP